MNAQVMCVDKDDHAVNYGLFLLEGDDWEEILSSLSSEDIPAGTVRIEIDIVEDEE